RMLSAIEPVVQQGLDVDLAKRYASAADMEEALTRAVPPASTSEVAAWVKSLGKDFIESRDKIIAAEEASWRRTHANIATQPGVRRVATLPGEFRRATSAAELQHEPLATESAPPPRAGGRAIIGVLAALVLLLGVGAVVAMKSGDAAPEPAAKPTPPAEPTPTAAAAPVPEPTPAAVTEPAPTAPEPATESAPVAAMPEPTPPPSETSAEKPVVTREAPPVKRAPVRPAPRPAVVKKEIKKSEEVPPAKPTPNPVTQAVGSDAKPAAADKPKDDCNPPYYFEGSKKVFKPACL
ncbi:MAG TPA: hypothetical protein VFV99_15930, partial [Kofleriaceae bacterium]|nr:hypothetical protein [Kofleriaceae bacterium]